MNVVKYIFGFLGWKQSEQVPVPVSDSLLDSVINENAFENASEPKMTVNEFIKHETNTETETETDFDQKLINRKNYNQKRNKLRKHKKR